MKLGVIGSSGNWGSKIFSSAKNVKNNWEIIGIDLADNQDWRNNTLDAVIISTPPALHQTMTEWYLNNHIHVLCEKPTSFSSKDQLKLNLIAENNKLVYKPGHILLFQPSIKEMLKIIEGQTIRHIESRRLNWGRLQTNINLAWHLAPHDISVIEQITNKLSIKLPSKDIKLITNKFNSSPLTDYAIFDLSYENFNSTITLGWQYPRKIREFVVTCDKMQLFVDDNSLIIIDGYYDCNNGLQRTKTTNLIIKQDLDPLELQIKDFLNCVENQKVSLDVHDHMYRVAWTVELMSSKLNV